MQTPFVNHQEKNIIFNLIPENTFEKNSVLKKTFDLYATYFRFTDIRCIHDKFNMIKTIICNNMISEIEKCKLMEIISMNQKIYLTMCRFIRIIKYNKSKTYDNDFDLHGESLEDISDKHKITIYHENTKYIFKLTDLVSIINHSLSKCDSFFVEPEVIKNPYTNIPFNLSTLYSIYFEIKKTAINSPLLFEMFFKSQFCIHKFKATYEPYILDEYIKNHINELSKSKMQRLCYEILHKYKRINRKMREFNFDRRYSTEKMIKVMKPIVRKYLFVKHSQNQGYRFECEREIIRQLSCLISNDKEFGKPQIKKSKRKNVQIVFESLEHLNTFQFNPDDELHINPAQDFKDNNYNFVEEKFEFAPPVISDKVDDAFLQRINEINNHRHQQEEERVRQEISRRRTILETMQNSNSQTQRTSEIVQHNSQSIYNIINEIMSEYTQHYNDLTEQLVPSSNVRRRLDFVATPDHVYERHIDENDLNETMSIQRIPQQIIPQETSPQETGPQETGPQESVSETESVNPDDDELGDSDDADDDDDTDNDLYDSDDSMPELVDRHSDEEIFAIDYDNSANSQVITRLPYSRIEDSIIYTDYEININEIRRSINNTNVSISSDFETYYFNTMNSLPLSPTNDTNERNDEDEESYDEGYDSF